MNLKVYMLFDRNENRFFSPCVGIDDKDFTKFLLNQLNVAYSNIKDEKEKPLFVSKIQACEVVKLGEIEELTGELINDKQFLLDLKDLEFDEKGDNKDEI